jgi:hypothetical protein
MPSDVKWHFIGHLQSNKAKKLVVDVPNLSIVETVDSHKLAKKLNDAAADINRGVLGIYLQINTSQEDSKSGMEAPEAPAVAKLIASSCPKLSIQGLMTIGAPGDASCFDALVACREQVALALAVEPGSLALSMGMSGDFEAAIAKGSTSVRVGSSIFGAREYPASDPSTTAVAAAAPMEEPASPTSSSGK